MNTQTENKLRKIERISVILRGGCTALLAVVTVVAVVATAAAAAGRMTRVSFDSQSLAIAETGLPSRLIVVAAIAATAVVVLKALHHLRRLLGNYSRREIFTESSAGQIRQFGISCILWGVVKAFWAFLPMMLSPEAPRSFALTPDSIVIGAVIIVISWFAEMASSMREENDLTI